MKRLAIAAVVCTMSASAFASPQVTPRQYSALAGAGTHSGSVCASYSGKNDLSTLLAPSSFSKGACFNSVSECRRWLRAVQTAFPVTSARRGCSRG